LLLSNGKSEEAGRVMIELLGTYTTENASQAREEAQRCIIASLAGTCLPVVSDIRVLIPRRIYD
jgi:translation initiation factor 3 subunit M